MKRGKTIYCKVSELKNYPIDAKTPCAGPYPNITGMRKLYWGYECTIVKAGAYIYKID